LKGKCPCGEEHNPADAKRQVEHVYHYRDASGQVVHETVRYRPKDFKQRRPDGKGGYVWSLKGTKTVLYRLPELLSADHALPVWICEGEKDADNGAAKGLVTTTNPMGATKWSDDYSDVLAGRACYIVPDNDDKGRQHVQKVAHSLYGKAACVKVIHLPGLSDHGDLYLTRP